ncbi:hypothetical protein LR48_Vigan07g013400 [Vigna angularis]|uniref:Uncharacterized protein n=1 Tax=Phaseolus angularis TaxID=3914 RepID=A0A0L9UU81_PHAAN|nr:hypothetical protein LR48_Vigan07g013400 [Vigna angularis]
MALQPKTEPGSLQSSISTTSQKHYSEMSISELVSLLRVVYQVEDFDKIEEELKYREDKVKVDIGSLREKLDLERLNSIEIEKRLKIREEQCKKGKQAQENYELLLKRMKQSGLDMDELRKRNVTLEKRMEQSGLDMDELRKRNVTLESEVCELKKKMVEDVKYVTELRTKLEEGKAENKSALDVLNMKNTELKEEIKKNLADIERLRTENDKLTDEKLERKTAFESLERKYGELSASVVKLENDVKLLLSEGASDCGNTEQEPNTGVSFAVKAEEVFDDYELENDTGEPVPFPKTKETHQYVKKGYKDVASGMEMKFCSVCISCIYNCRFTFINIL